VSEMNNHFKNDRDCQSPEHSDHRGVLEVIRAIKIGGLDPKRLSLEDRQACVMHLGLEGLSVPEIAQVLNVSDRTVMRDRKALQRANAIEHDPKLAGQFAGRLAIEAEACISRIRRVTRDKEALYAVKVDGEKACFEIVDKLSQRLQSMGFLPTAAQQIQADLTHHAGDLMGLVEIRAETERLEQIQRETVDVEAAPVSPQTNNPPALPEPGGQEQGENNDEHTK